MGTSLDELNKKSTDVGNIQHLKEAFTLFSQETKRLEQAYTSLNKQFKKMENELKVTNLKLKGKVKELDSATLYLHNILQNMTQGIIFISVDGLISTFNASAETILEFPQETILFHEFKNSFKDSAFGFSMEEALEKQSTPEIIHIQWEEKILEVTTRFIMQEERQQSGIILLLKEITELCRLQKIETHNDRMKKLGEMAACVAHEIRNPLGGIRGYAALLSRDLKEDTKKAKMCSYIVQGTERLDQLISEVLQYSRPVHPNFQLTEICQLILDTQTLASHDSEFQEKITFENNFYSSPTLFLDSEMIRRTLLNLFMNAIQATETKGIIRTEITTTPSDLLITVSDTGRGIAKKNLDKIFLPFFTTKITGSGFGLSEVYKVIQAHGGSIEVASTEGNGTTFTLNLPLHELKK